MSWTVLIVDDAPVARSQLRVALEAHDVQVVEAENGREGLWRAQERTVDLVISDVHMPVMTGLVMIQELRKSAEYATTPIFILSSDPARIEEGRKAGASAWMLKPLRPDEMWKAVQKALLGRPSRDGAVR